MYGVVSNSFLRGGGDGHTMFREAEDAHDFGPLLADVVAGYLAARVPYSPYTDGRIRAGRQGRAMDPRLASGLRAAWDPRASDRKERLAMERTIEWVLVPIAESRPAPCR